MSALTIAGKTYLSRAAITQDLVLIPQAPEPVLQSAVTQIHTSMCHMMASNAWASQGLLLASPLRKDVRKRAVQTVLVRCGSSALETGAALLQTLASRDSWDLAFLKKDGSHVVLQYRTHSMMRLVTLSLIQHDSLTCAA